MRKAAILIVVLAAAICSLTQTAHSIDTLINVTVWNEAEGGNGHTYAVLAVTKNWTDASATAASLQMAGSSGYLASITSQAENDFILHNVLAGINSQPEPSLQNLFYIGGTQPECDWNWSTNESFCFMNWAPTEPNNFGVENVTGIWGHGETDWRRPAGGWNNTLPDDLSNEHAVQWSVVEWGNLNLDTEPCHANQDTIFNLVTWNEADGGNGHTYAVIGLTLNWTEANALAPTLSNDALPGYLATITSQEENDFILNNVLTGITTQPSPSLQNLFFTGGTGESIYFSWQNGESFCFINWSPTEPNNIGVETVTGIWGFGETDSRRPAGGWNNTSPDDCSNPYAVQWSVIEWGTSNLDTEPCPVDTIINLVTWPESEGGNGHTYAVIGLTMNWTQANAFALSLEHESLPGYLATITSPAENQFIVQHVLSGITNQPFPSLQNLFYTGAVDYGCDWNWQNGESFCYLNWSPTEPNNIGIETVTGIWGYGETDYRRPAGGWNNTSPDNSSNQYAVQWSVIEWGEANLDTAACSTGADTLINIVTWPEADGGNGHTYAVISLTINWTEANALAPTLTREALPGYLATITSQEENDFILHNVLAGIQNQPSPSLQNLFYTGGTGESYAFTWQNGESFCFINWSPTEPNNIGIETVTGIWGFGETDSRRPAGGWNNTSPDDCSNPYAVQWSVIEWGTSNLDTEPCPVDTIINLVTWPESEGGNGHTYAVIGLTMNWTQANAFALSLEHESLPGYLATITSPAENQFIVQHVLSGITNQPFPSLQNLFYTGAVDYGCDWNWQNGESFCYFNWSPTEPNNIGIETVSGIWGYGETDWRRPAGGWNNTSPDNSSSQYAVQWSVIEWGESNLDTAACSAGADTLINIVTWNEADGGNGHTYAIIGITLNWSEADALAPALMHEANSGYLATITSAEENDFILQNVLSGISHQPFPSLQNLFYVGAVQAAGLWAWQNGETMNFFNWSPTEPNNLYDETVMGIWGFGETDDRRPSGGWNNTWPDDCRNPYALQWSVIEWGEPDPANFLVDTLANIISWSSLDGGNDHTYAITKVSLNWTDANAFAPTLDHLGKPGYLATITSAEENEFILSHILANFTGQPSALDQFYLGGVYDGVEWGWQSGETFDFTNWSLYEPNNEGIETVIAVWGVNETDERRAAGTWNSTLPDNSFNPFTIQWSIIEWDVPDTTKSIIEPEPVSALSAHTKIPATVEIYLGNFEGDENIYNENTLDYGSIVINNTVTPISVVAVSSHPKFKSGVVKISVNSDDFINTYDFMWGMTIESFNITAMFSNNTSFSNDAIVKIQGYIAGDVNLDGGANILDLTTLVDYLFRGGSEPLVPETSDVDNSCGIANIIDLTYYVDFLFRGGPPPLPGCSEI